MEMEQTGSAGMPGTIMLTKQVPCFQACISFPKKDMARTPSSFLSGLEQVQTVDVCLNPQNSLKNGFNPQNYGVISNFYG